MRHQDFRLLLLLVPVALAGVLVACGPAMVQPAPPPPPPGANSGAEAPRPEPDAWRDFRGQHVKGGETFRVAASPVAVDGPNVVVTLLKAEWSTMSTPSGKDIKEIAATLQVEKGQEQRQVVVPQNDARTVLGVRVHVVAGGEDYNKQRLVYEPWVDLRVEPLE